jgi:hypothetical protein
MSGHLRLRRIGNANLDWLPAQPDAMAVSLQHRRASLNVYAASLNERWASLNEWGASLYECAASLGE